MAETWKGEGLGTRVHFEGYIYNRFVSVKPTFFSELTKPNKEIIFLNTN